jgi:hypothetical protein
MNARNAAIRGEKKRISCSWIAQLVEREAVNFDVGGSIPPPGAKIGV